VVALPRLDGQARAAASPDALRTRATHPATPARPWTEHRAAKRRPAAVAL